MLAYARTCLSSFVESASLHIEWFGGKALTAGERGRWAGKKNAGRIYVWYYGIVDIFSESSLVRLVNEKISSFILFL